MPNIDDLTREETDEIEKRYVNELNEEGLDEKECSLEDVLESDCSLSTKSIFALRYLITKIPRR